MISFLSTLYFCLPKVDLFYLPGALTGVRVQDLIVLVIFFSLRRLPKKLLLLQFFILLNIFGVLLSGMHTQFAIGFFRLFEYQILGFAIYSHIFNNRSKLASFLFSVVFVSSVLSVLQYFYIIPNFDPGRGLLISKEFSGSFGTPAELSYVIAILFYIYVYLLPHKSIAAFILPLVMFNQVKAVGLVFFLVSLERFVLHPKKKILRNILYVTAVATITFILIFTFWDIFQKILFTIANTNPTIYELKSSDFELENQASLAMRLGKWTLSLSFLYNNPVHTLLGVGLLSQFGALDGGILRLIFEMGIPLTLFIIWKLYKLSPPFLVLFISTNLLFDGYLSSVTSPLLFSIFYYYSFGSSVSVRNRPIATVA